MKKIAFVAVLIAAIVGIVFGGLSVAGATAHRELGPTCTPHPTPTPDCCQDVNGKVTNIQGNISIMQGNLDTLQATVNSISGNVTPLEGKLDDMANSIVRMDDYDGRAISSDPNTWPLRQYFDNHGDWEVAHVSLTLFAFGIDDPSDQLEVRGYSYLPPGLIEPHVGNLTTSNYINGQTINIQFDQPSWEMYLWNHGGEDMTVYWWATSTYTSD